MPKRGPEHMEAQKERILRAVIECVARKGVERTSIADIRRSTGLSAGALYVHFANKGEMVSAALHYGNLMAQTLPHDWQAIIAALSSLDDQLGFDIETVVRCRLHLHGESLSDGPLRDVLKPLLQDGLQILTARLENLSDNGQVKLAMSAQQAAISIAAFIEGLLIINLSLGYSSETISTYLKEGISRFIQEV